MDAGSDVQQGANKSDVDTTYHVDVWLPDKSEYPELGETSKKVKASLDAALSDVQNGNKEIKIRFKYKVYKRSDKDLNIDRNSVAAISFSEDFAKKYHWSAKTGDVAVLAMMGGWGPAGKNFFRMGFSCETIATIIGDQLVKDQSESPVLLIRVKNDLGENFEQAFLRTVKAKRPKWSVSTLTITEDTESEYTLYDQTKKRTIKSIAEWLSEYIPLNEGRESDHSVVIYGYWQDYWKIVKEVLTNERFRKNNCWLYVESNYPLFAPIFQNVKNEGSGKLKTMADSVSEKGTDGQKVANGQTDLVKDWGQGGINQILLEEGYDIEDKSTFRLHSAQEPEGDAQVTNEQKQVAYQKSLMKTGGDKGKNDSRPTSELLKVSPCTSMEKMDGKVEVEQEELKEDDYRRIRCFTGKLVEKENSFITFAKETVRLLRAAIRYAQDKLEKEEKQDDIIPYIRERICEFLVRSKFYASEHLGSFFFRKDGELFFPLYLYNGKLERQRIVRESCCNDVEFTKEAIADQLLQLSNSLSKITRAKIPRNLKVSNLDGAKEVFEEFCDRIAEISGGGEIDFVSYYPNTERQFYPWHKKGKNVGKTEQFVTGSIFDDVCKKIQGVIQINLKDFDLEDNDAYRVYLVYERTEKVFDVLTLAEWWNTQKDAQSKILDGNEGWESDLLPVKAVVFTKSRIRKQDGQTWEGLSEDEYKNIINKANYVHYYRDCDGHESKFKFDEILSGLCKLLGCSGDNGNSESDARFLYYIPEYIPEDNKPEGNNSYKTGGQGGIVMATCCKLSLFDLQIIENMVSRIFSKLKTCLAEHDVLLSNIKSAIGSIMSRNGSHNIGSHVLAALSHNVGTMPDDRVLYQYIQHRMDYIATAATEFPLWKQPTMFVATVMKEFLRQTHLLDYISGSEGLHAYKFQGPLAGGNQEDTIRIHVRRVNEEITNWENKGFGSADNTDITEFVVYSKDNDSSLQKESVQQPDFSKDVSVAIPGGVVGQHAFYTILENILRNAAKHEWSKSVKKVDWIRDELNSIHDELRKLKNAKEEECDLYKSDDIPQRPKHLDLYVDFVDCPIKSKVECRIWNDKLIDVKKNSKATAYIVSKRIEICNQKNNDGAADTSCYVRLVLDAYDVISAYNEIATKQKDGKEEDGWGILSPVLLGEIKSPIEEVEKECEKMGLPKSDPEYNKKRLAVVRNLLEENGYSKKLEESLEEFLVCQEVAAARCLKYSMMTKISESFIEDETGQLRKENWGIAEMRISAGYLQCSEIDVIGGLSTKESALSLIWPVLVKNERTEECIGYRFKLQKPKELLVIVPEDVDSEKINKVNLLLSDYGIEIMTRDKAASSNGLAYSYALIDQVNFDVAEGKWSKLPLRVLTPQGKVYGRKNQTINIIAEYQGSFYADIGESLNRIIASKDIAKESAMLLLRDVYESWIDHLRRERGISNESSLLVDVAGTANGAGKSLITDADLLHFVFKHLFNSSTRGYLVTFAPKYKRNDADEIVLDKFQMNRELAGALYSLITLKRKPLMSVLDFAKTSCNEKRIAHQLSRLNDEVYVESILQEGKIVGEIDANMVDSVWGKELNGLQKWFCFVYLQKACDAVYQRPKGVDYADFRAFVRFLGNVVLEQTRAILAKYEERIATLPTAFGVASAASVNGKVEAKWMRTKQTFLSVSFSSNRDERTMQMASKGFCYWRHGDDNVEEKDRTFIDKSLYFEPLSGSQSYLGMLSALHGNVGAIRSDCVEEQVPVIRDVTRLMENALLRILIIDERTKKFVSDHQFEKRFERMGIFACDENDTLTADLIFGSGTVSSRFEIVVVHQGIIDKLWKDHSQSGVDELLQNLKRRCRYVVITTGRGIPANIPQTARVLPFSIIEGSLFKQYPEKMILVDAIMNILPTGRRQ